MNRKRKYRCWLLVFLALDLILMGWLGYRLLDRKIPDQILVDHEDSREVANLLKRPFSALMMRSPFQEKTAISCTADSWE